MNIQWFRRNGMFFVPRSWAGWMILAAGVAFAVYRFIDIDRHSHSASDTLIPFSINMLLAVAVYSIIGYFTSRR